MITPPNSGAGGPFTTRETSLRDNQPRVPLKVLQGGGGLVARGVGKTYRRRPVVRNVSVSLNRGEAVGLLGPNGAGKTTTFYMIVGLVSPGHRLDPSRRLRHHQPCRCIAAPGWALATCRRRPACSAA